jgi:hypothetical protein
MKSVAPPGTLASLIAAVAGLPPAMIMVPGLSEAGLTAKSIRPGVQGHVERKSSDFQLTPLSSAGNLPTS